MNPEIPSALQVKLTNPYYAGKLKERGRSIENLKIVKHFFVPKPIDLIRLSEFLQDCKTVLDVGSGYGLLINSLAKRTNCSYLGIDTMYWDKKFPMPTPEKNVKFEFMGLEPMAYPQKWKRKLKRFDCVICSWMPYASDWREMLSILSKKKIILILSNDLQATGTIEVYGGMDRFGFKLSKSAWQSKDSIIQFWEKTKE